MIIHVPTKGRHKLTVGPKFYYQGINVVVYFIVTVTVQFIAVD